MLNVHVVSPSEGEVLGVPLMPLGVRGTDGGVCTFRRARRRENHKQNDNTKYKQARLGNTVKPMV